MTHAEQEAWFDAIAKVAKAERAIIFETHTNVWGAGKLAMFPTRRRRLLPKRKDLLKATQ